MNVVNSFVQLLRVLLVSVVVLLLLPFESVVANPVPVEINGTLYKVFGDDEKLNLVKTRYFLIDERGTSIDLDLSRLIADRANQVSSLINKKVTVVGVRGASQNPAITVNNLIGVSTTTQEAALSAIATGAKPYITLLCRFRDKRKVTPNEIPFYQGMMGTNFPGLDHFWRENSYDQMNLTGSDVQGWYNLPKNEADYVNESGVVALSVLLNDCANEADRDVFFPDFAGINMVFNGTLGCCSWGGQFGLTIDGQNRGYGVTWISEGSAPHQYAYAHEMGHSLGLNHSSGPYGQTYDSGWDVMSKWPSFNHNDPTYGILGINTVSMHKDILGWVGARKYVTEPGSSQTILLERLALPVDGNGYLMAEIDRNGNDYLTVEARRFSGYDGLAGGTVEGIPLEGVVIHSITPLITGGLSATVVDSNDDGNNDVNDGSAVWLPGEVFEDPDNGITVSVDADTGTGYLVTVTRDTAMLGDAVVSSVSGPAAAATGTSMMVTDTVTNAGVGALPSVGINLYLSEDNIITPSDVRIGNHSTGAYLASGESITTDTVVTVPSAEMLPLGNYYLGAIADEGNITEESDETNNAFAGSAISISIGPDLAMTQLSGPGSGIAGGQITVTNTILNQGTGATPAGVYASIYLSTDNVIDVNDTCILSRFSTQLSSGESSTVDSIVYLSSSLPAGVYYLGAIADSQCNTGSITESDETNNTLLGNQITIEGAAVDFAVTAVSGPGREKIGNAVNVSVTVNNAGSAVSSNVLTAVYLSTDAVITTDDILIGTVDFSSLTPGESQTRLVPSTIPTSVTKGDYYFGAIVDYLDFTAEPDEANNALAGNIVSLK